MSIIITPADADEPHTARTLELDAGERLEAINHSKLPTNTSYTVEVTVEDGPSETFDWDVSLAPLCVLLDEGRNINFLLEAG